MMTVINHRLLKRKLDNLSHSRFVFQGETGASNRLFSGVFSVQLITFLFYINYTSILRNVTSVFLFPL